MNYNEFNSKWSKYKADGHYGLEITNEKVIEFLDELFKTLVEIPGFKYRQIKVKFGYSRFYSTLPLKVEWEIEKRINKILREN